MGQRLIIPAYFKAYNKAGNLTDYAPTVNHMYIPIRSKSRGSMLVLKPEAQVWLQEVAWLAREWVNKTGWKMPEKGRKVVVRAWYWFKDDTRADPNNYHKALLDALEGMIYANDKHVLVRDMDYDFDKQNPRIELEFEVMEE